MEHVGFLSLLPIFVAITLAITVRNVILALFAAIWLAGTIFKGGNPIDGLVHSADHLVVAAIANDDHARIILFCLMVGAMIGILFKTGATRAFVNYLGRLASGKRSTQVLTWFSGLFIFFDDYANCLVVGNSMRPLYDRMKVSRAKLAYVVDSTAAPVASISLISTWVAFQVGLMDAALKKAGAPIDAYSFYLKGVGYNFYAIFTLVFVLAIAISGRDFGPMLRAERAQRKLPVKPLLDEHKHPFADRLHLPHFWLFLIPVLSLIVVSISVLFWEGSKGLDASAPLFEILGNADNYDALMKGALAAIVSAFFLALMMKALSVVDLMTAMMDGARELFDAVAVLVLAWTLSAAVAELGAAEYLVATLKTSLPAQLLPTIVFVLSGIIAFSTGTSYGTMGLLMPIVIPLSFAMSPTEALPIVTAASVLGGAVFGDHCSPISDTTIMSSMGSGCDLIEHVRTQLPYALTAGGVSIVFGTLPAGFGAPLWLSLILGILACLTLVRLLGRHA